MIDDQGRSADAAYLIVVHDALIRQDIAQAVAEVSDAKVIAVDTVVKAADAIAGMAHVTLAFIEATPDLYRASMLAVDLAARNARVVLVGAWDDRTAKADGWAVLRFPFTTADVHALLLQEP